MRAIPTDAGVQHVLSLVRVLSLRLQARPDTRPIDAEVSAARADLKRLYEQWEVCRDATVAATGALHFVDEVEDGAVADVARRLKVEVRGDLQATLWLRLFSQAPSELTRGVADETQAELVAHVIHSISHDPEYAALKELLPELEAARREVDAARAERTRCERAEASAWNEVQIAERKAREAYHNAYPRLQLVFPGKKRLVESFFYQKPRKPRVKDTREQPAVTDGI